MERDARHGSGPVLARRSAVMLMVIGSSVVLVGCTGQKLMKPAICNGQHRRLGTPYGSILPGAPIPSTTAPAGPGSPVTAGAPPMTTGMKTSARAAAAYPSC